MKVTAVILVTDDGDTLIIKPLRVVGFGTVAEVGALAEKIEKYLKRFGMRPEGKKEAP